MDFGDLKRIVKENINDVLDHALILPSDMDIDGLRKLGESFSKVHVVGFQPTSENLLNDFASRISGLLPAGVTLYSLRLRETANSYAEWYSG